MLQQPAYPLPQHPNSGDCCWSWQPGQCGTRPTTQVCAVTLVPHGPWCHVTVSFTPINIWRCLGHLTYMCTLCWLDESICCSPFVSIQRCCQHMVPRVRPLTAGACNDIASRQRHHLLEPHGHDIWPVCCCRLPWCGCGLLGPAVLPLVKPVMQLQAWRRLLACNVVRPSLRGEQSRHHRAAWRRGAVTGQ